MSSQNKRHKHIAVIGRMPEQDSQLFKFFNLTIDEAERQFEADLYADERPEKKGEVEAWHGTAYYIDFILTSEAPMEVDFR